MIDPIGCVHVIRQFSSTSLRIGINIYYNVYILLAPLDKSWAWLEARFDFYSCAIRIIINRQALECHSLCSCACCVLVLPSFNGSASGGSLCHTLMYHSTCSIGHWTSCQSRKLWSMQQEFVSSIGGRQIVSDNSEWKERVCMEHGRRVACH